MLEALSQLFTDVRGKMKNLSQLTGMFAAEVRQGDTLPSCFTSRPLNKYNFCGLFSAMFSGLLCSLVAILLLNVVSKHSSEGRSKCS